MKLSSLDHNRVVRRRTLRVLAVIMDLAPGSVTLRRIAKKTGICHNAVRSSLLRLERRGLISREFNRGNTIRPRVKFIPVEKLYESEAK